MRPSRSFLRVAAILAAAALAAPAGAAASDFCVNDPACVSGGGTDQGTGGAGLKAALDAAAAHPNAGGPDRVLVGPGTYTRSSGGAPAYPVNGGDALVLRGAGPDATVLTRDEVNSAAVIGGSANAIVKDLAVVIPGATSMTGIGVGGGEADNVKVTVAPGGAMAPTGVTVSTGGRATGARLTIPNGTGATLNPGSTLADSVVSGTYGVQASGSSVAVRRSRVYGTSYGILSYYAGLTVEDTLVDLGGASSVGISPVANVNGDATAALRHVTVVNGGAGATGLWVQGYSGKTSTVAMRDSIVTAVGHPVVQSADGAGAVASLSTSYSYVRQTGNLRSGSNGAAMPAAPAESNALTGDTGFVDGLGGDWRLRHDSPLVDAGTPGALNIGESPTDVEGLPRLVGGRRDVGASEYQRRAPVVSAVAGATSAEVGVPVTFEGSATEADPGESIAGYQWTFDDGAGVPAGPGASHAFSTPGTHTATLTATDSAGSAGTAAVTVEVTSAAAPPIVPPGGDPAPKPTAAPVLSTLSLRPKAFRPGKGRRAARLSYTLSAPARIVFTVERATPGRRRGKVCGAPRRRSGKRCTRYVALAGSFAHQGVKGANQLRFDGRIAGRRLKPGRYALVAQVPGGVAVRAAFRIARSRR